MLLLNVACVLRSNVITSRQDDQTSGVEDMPGNNEQTGEVQDDIRGIQLSNKNELSPFKHSFSLHIFFYLRIIFFLPDGAR